MYTHERHRNESLWKVIILLPFWIQALKGKHELKDEAWQLPMEKESSREMLNVVLWSQSSLLFCLFLSRKCSTNKPQLVSSLITEGSGSPCPPPHIFTSCWTLVHFRIVQNDCLHMVSQINGSLYLNMDTKYCNLQILLKWLEVTESCSYYRVQLRPNKAAGNSRE